MADFSENKDYNLYNYFYGKYNKITPLLAFDENIKTVEAYKVWRENSLCELRKVLGFDKMFKQMPLNCEKGRSEECEGKNVKFVRTRIVLETQHDLKMPVYVLEPKEDKNGRAVIAVHGHGSNGKEGLSMAFSSKSVEKFNYVYAIEFVKMGYTVFVPDLPEAGERCVYIGHDGKTATCNDVNNVLMSIGLSLQGVTVFDLICLVDYIKENYNFSKLGCVGFSGGGHSALWLGAVDDRIDFSIISGYFHSFRDIALTSNWCGCNYIPNLWNYVDVCDLAALMAERKLFIETGDKDKLNGVRGLTGTYEMLEKANKAFAVFNNKIEFKANDGAHKWYGSCYEWLNNVL
jgi:hypothetical protein